MRARPPLSPEASPSSDRDRMLARVREALRERERPGHPGPFLGERPTAPDPERAHVEPPRTRSDPWPSRPGAAAAADAPDAAEASAATLEGFRAVFEAAGGEVVRVADQDAAVAWLADFATGFDAVAVGRTVPDALRSILAQRAPEAAFLGVSMARGAVAETGSLLMDARDGRRAQLLPPVHVVLVEAHSVHRTLRSALTSIRDDLPSAIGLHSGPSKSADLGQVLVKGVHGPGRVIAVLVGGS